VQALRFKSMNITLELPAERLYNSVSLDVLATIPLFKFCVFDVVDALRLSTLIEGVDPTGAHNFISLVL